ncbi:MAG: preprotein translocase subunit SecA, partial [Ruminiclostridium sp.]|nr:preprotein translocase subunit SecA [Ruminiclostridium sp.]
KHEVLNAKNHEREAEIVAQAGKKGAVTIATNMAGRGTDIMLGGNAEYLAKAEMRRQGVPDELINEATGFAETTDEEILAARKQYMELNEKYKQKIAPEAEEVRNAGGLFILGTERHESRRIDNQLRGRAGRQGDPGESCFFVSLEDDLMRLFGGDRVQAVMETLKIDEDIPIENSILTKTIESSQRKIEGRNYQIRKSVLDFDDVMSQQRMTIYSQRSKVLDGDDISDSIKNMITDSIKENVDMFCQGDIADNWNITGLREHYAGVLTTPDDLTYTNDELNEVTKKDIIEMLTERAEAIYAAKEAEYGSEVMRELERVVLLRNVDQKWMDHIDAMDELKRGIYLRSMGQKDPVVEYRFEGFAMFDEMIAAIREDTARAILTARLASNRQAPQRVQVMRPSMPQGTVRRATPKPTKKDKKAAAKERAANAKAASNANDDAPAGETEE